MTEAERAKDPATRKPLVPLILGLLLALAGGGGGFYAVHSGLILGPPDATAMAVPPAEDATGPPPPLPDVAFVPLAPMVISLPGGNARHLRFTAQLEVPSAARADVERLLPRVVDVFNSYLRAVEVADLEEPTALLRFRAHLLRRAQLVLGDERVRNLLVMEFVVN